MNARAVSVLAIVAGLLAGASLQAAEPEPLPVAKQGYLFAGGKYSTINGKQVMSGQIYAEYQIPLTQTHPYPIVMVHGAIQTGTNFTGTPDGREGWAQYFLRQGYAVYVVDQPGRARSSYQPDLNGPQATPDLLNTQRRFTAPAEFNLWPQAKLHTQWPGKGMQGDPVFDQFFASQVPYVQAPGVTQLMNRDALVALLEKIGPSIIMTHSQSGAYGWPVADARPDLVKAVIAVEPSGPPVRDAEFKGAPDYFVDGPQTKPWGLGAMKLTYGGANDASGLAFVQQQKSDAPDLMKCWRQREPARELTNLKSIPVLIVASEASYHASYDHCTAQYLAQAGVKNTFIRLADRGIKGNGHMMMLEKNNQEIAALMAGWLKDIK